MSDKFPSNWNNTSKAPVYEMSFSLGTSKDNLIYAGGFYKRIHVQLFAVHFYEYVAFYFVDAIFMTIQRLITWWQGSVQLYYYGALKFDWP